MVEHNPWQVEKISCRTLVIHGRQDTVVPFSHGEEIHGMLQKPHPPLWIDGAGHNDMIEVLELYNYNTRQFIANSCCG